MPVAIENWVVKEIRDYMDLNLKYGNNSLIYQKELCDHSYCIEDLKNKIISNFSKDGCIVTHLECNMNYVHVKISWEYCDIISDNFMIRKEMYGKMKSLPEIKINYLMRGRVTYILNKVYEYGNAINLGDCYFIWDDESIFSFKHNIKNGFVIFTNPDQHNFVRCKLPDSRIHIVSHSFPERWLWENFEEELKLGINRYLEDKMLEEILYKLTTEELEDLKCKILEGETW
jgi:hypothetical protein